MPGVPARSLANAPPDATEPAYAAPHGASETPANGLSSRAASLFWAPRAPAPACAATALVVQPLLPAVAPRQPTQRAAARASPRERAVARIPRFSTAQDPLNPNCGAAAQHLHRQAPLSKREHAPAPNLIAPRRLLTRCLCPPSCSRHSTPVRTALQRPVRSRPRRTPERPAAPAGGAHVAPAPVHGAAGVSYQPCGNRCRRTALTAWHWHRPP